MCLPRRRIRQCPRCLPCMRRRSWVRRSGTPEAASHRPNRRPHRCTSCLLRSRTSALASCTLRLRPQAASPGTCRNSTYRRPRRLWRRTCSLSSHTYTRGAPRMRRRRPYTSPPSPVAPSGRRDTPYTSTRASLRPRTHRRRNRNRCTDSSSPPYRRSGCPGRSLGMPRRHPHLRRLLPVQPSPCCRCSSQAAQGLQPGST
jgi:hypothetical protein